MYVITHFQAIITQTIVAFPHSFLSYGVNTTNNGASTTNIGGNTIKFGAATTKFGVNTTGYIEPESAPKRCNFFFTPQQVSVGLNLLARHFER